MNTIEYLYKSVLMSYIAQLGEEDPANKYAMLMLFKEIDSGRFDAKNIHREQEDLYEAALRAKEAIALFEEMMELMGMKK